MKPTKLSTFYVDVYRPRRQPSGKRGTAKNYLATLAHFQKYLDRDPHLEDLIENTLHGFRAWLVAKPELGNVTVNFHITRLLTLARYAFRKGVLDEEPDVHPLQEPKRVPVAFRVNQISKMLESATLTPGRIGEIAACDWWMAFIQVLYWTGLRKGAALAIEQANVDRQGSFVLVFAETQKQNADQVFRLPADCMVAIEVIWEPPRRLLFPWPHSDSTFYVHFRRLLTKAELPSSRRDLCHKIRRTTYSYSKLGGIDAGHQLGHHSDQSARYEDPTITQQRQAADVLPSPTLPKPRLRVI
ncbi:hypothetical protein LCGC14_0326380 [marine sediment metagenome]|uniref:Phage integrase SAM-like domain-containing protein n=1 Tax=marine sediment metagenome TaxID=412755 RepID=A0A0F9W5A1_9ZZZZ